MPNKFGTTIILHNSQTSNWLKAGNLAPQQFAVIVYQHNYYSRLI